MVIYISESIPASTGVCPVGRTVASQRSTRCLACKETTQCPLARAGRIRCRVVARPIPSPKRRDRRRKFQNLWKSLEIPGNLWFIRCSRLLPAGADGLEFDPGEISPIHGYLPVRLRKVSEQECTNRNLSGNRAGNANVTQYCGTLV